MMKKFQQMRPTHQSVMQSIRANAGAPPSQIPPVLKNDGSGVDVDGMDVDD